MNLCKRKKMTKKSNGAALIRPNMGIWGKWDVLGITSAAFKGYAHFALKLRAFDRH